MSHRYPTRFQVKKEQVQPQAVQPQAQPQTVRLQAAQPQAAPPQDTIVQDGLKLMKQQEASSAIVNYCLARYRACESFLDKVHETIRLFEYLYEQPILLTTHTRFKDVTWHKMVQLDKELTDVLMRLPCTLDINLHDLNIRTNIARLHNLMNMIRQKYY